MSKPTRRARLAGLGALLTGLAVSAALVWQASYSAFTATTSNPTNNWTAGQLALTDDDSDSALFTVTGMKPGDTGTKCIVVTSNSNVITNVRMYATAFAQTKTVADNMTLRVEQGNSSSVGGNCASFASESTPVVTTGSLTAFSSARTNWSNGFGSWAPAAGNGVKKTYQITWTFNNVSGNQTATDAMQGGTAQIGFTWEAQAGT
ncbi:MAG: hypothetical protein INR66_26025 [Gordonia polyisoprenivorans]|nr:hypothetical protein [Gordonia polyisoprenivorans]